MGEDATYLAFSFNGWDHSHVAYEDYIEIGLGFSALRFLLHRHILPDVVLLIHSVKSDRRP